jgi:hypothetical protein
MTSEQRTVIEIRDISGIELECPDPKCKARVFYPIDKQDSKIAFSCPACNRDWFSAYDPRAGNKGIEHIKSLMHQLNLLNSENRGDIFARVRLELSSIPLTLKAHHSE